MLAQKFMFDTVFSAEGEILREPAARTKYFTIEEVEAEKNAAFEAGKKNEEARGAQQTAAAIAALAQRVERLSAELEAERKALRDEAGTLALAAAKAIAGRALDAFGAERVEGIVAECLDGLRGAARLVIRLPPAELERLSPSLEHLADEHGFSGALVMRAEPGLRTGDVRIEWGDGAVIVDRAEMIARVEEIVARALSVTARETIR